MFNMLAWICGFALDEAQIIDFVPLEDRHSCKLLSVAEDLIYLASDGKKLTPKGLFLALIDTLLQIWLPNKALWMQEGRPCMQKYVHMYNQLSKFERK